jgi:hypothetical protein
MHGENVNFSGYDIDNDGQAEGENAKILDGSKGFKRYIIMSGNTSSRVERENNGNAVVVGSVRTRRRPESSENE